ncbi:NADP-dependent oxidoreductase [Streptomyces mirabilis]|uniref:NADP-dependent oxidoreductase n=1 Tax=Streptomyces mirabilis TaxID=68239 RepID=UPI00362A794C
MKAVRFHQYGDPDVLRYEDVEQPVPGAGQVRVRVAATSFNLVDANIRAGFMQGPIPVTLPHSPGIDVAGTVDALGEGVTAVPVGDQVIGFLPMAGPGAAAEYVLAPVEALTPAPKSVALSDAAALPLVGLTAWQALFEHVKLTAGQRVLVNGAGGAVGGYAVQLAKQAGAVVIATAGPRSSRCVTAAGADKVIDHTTADIAAAVSQPVDVVLNLAPVEPAQLDALLGLIRPGGDAQWRAIWPVVTGRGRDPRAGDAAGDRIPQVHDLVAGNNFSAVCRSVGIPFDAWVEARPAKRNPDRPRLCDQHVLSIRRPAVDCRPHSRPPDVPRRNHADPRPYEYECRWLRDHAERVARPDRRPRVRLRRKPRYPGVPR